VKPFLRATDRGQLAPVGWVSEPAGLWAGKEHEVVYDPRRHDVAFVRHDVGEPVREGFRDVGYHRTVIDGDSEMWVRDRLAVVTAAMDRVEHQLGREPAAEIGGRSL
jgi:hypothetical protein